MPTQSGNIAGEEEVSQSTGIGGFPIIVAVGVNDTVTQYQNNVLIQIEEFTETIVSVTLNGVACPIQSQSFSSSVTVNIPGTVATGNHTVLVSGASESASRTVTYTKTHPLACPVNGTTIPGSSATDPARSLIFGVALDLAPFVVVGALPASLQFKSPHAAWTAGNINLPLTEVLEPSVTAVDGQVVNVSLGVLKSDGSSTSANVSIRIYLNVAHVLRLTAANGTQLQAINYTFPNGWIITDDSKFKLQNIVFTLGEGTVTQDNLVAGDIGDLTLGEFALIVLIDAANNLATLCPDIEVEAA